MDSREAPALLPALGLAAGACLAAQLSTLPRPECAFLVALGLALGRPAGRLVAGLGLGLLAAGVQWIEPREALASLELRRPVEITARSVSHPTLVRRAGREETLLRVRTLQIEQSRRAVAVEIDVMVSLPPAFGEAVSEPPALGATLRLKGYLRRSQGFANTPHARPGVWRLRLQSTHFMKLEEPPVAALVLGGRWRRWAEEALEQVAGRAPDSLALPLVRSLLLGDRTELPLSWQQILRRLGLAHLLAVSGLHVGLLAMLVLFLTLPLPRGVRYGATLAAVIVYLLLIGPRPAVLRASIMGLLCFGALLLRRPPQALNALAVCVFALVLQKPAIVAELGFQLSVAATGSIIVLSPLYYERWRGLPPWLRRPLAASLAAQLATAPLLLPFTGAWHPAAALLNLVAIPWLGLFLLGAFPWLLLALLSAEAAAALLPVLDAVASPLAGLAARPPMPAGQQLLTLPVASAWAVAAALAVLGLRPRAAVPALLGLALLSLTGAPAEGPAVAELVLLDVGQGDAVLLRDGPHALLVDGGGWPAGDLGGRVLLPALAGAGVRRLDAVLLTHPDLDHCGGLADLVRYLPVAEIWTGPSPPAKQQKGDRYATGERCAERLLSAPGPRLRGVERGDELRLGRWRLEVLHPAADDRGKSNDLSVVLLARFGSRRVLLTGDIEAAAESSLLRRSAGALRADVLKVAHHGSKSSTSAVWLRAVAPRLALISAGVNNPYGHPAPGVLERLEEAGVRVLRTDRSGLVRLEFHDDGRMMIDLPFAPRN